VKDLPNKSRAAKRLWKSAKVFVLPEILWPDQIYQQIKKHGITAKKNGFYGIFIAQWHKYCHI
jgi:hypothetical protein